MNIEEELIEQPYVAPSETKACSKCGEELSLDAFHNDKSKKDGKASYCKACKKLHIKEYYEQNKDRLSKYAKEYREANADKISEWKKEHYENNKEYILERVKEYHIDNRERILVGRRAYYDDNKEVFAIKAKAYYETNKEKLSEYNKWYREANKERLSEQSRKYNKTPKGKESKRRAKAKRRATKLSNIVEDINTTELAVIHTNCFWCLQPHEGTYHVDHFYPLANNGTYTKDNLVISCPRCNRSKGAKDPYLFGDSIGLSKEEITSRLKAYE